MRQSNDILTMTMDLVTRAIDKATDFDPARLPGLIRDVHESIAAVQGDAPSTGTYRASELQGSKVYDEGPVGDLLWPGISAEKRYHFLNLADRYQLKRDSNGYPLPNTPNGEIFDGDDTVFDPFTGDPMKMLKSRLHKSYQLDRDDFLAMFRLPESTPITAPATSSEKRDVAIRNGLGFTKTRTKRGASAKISGNARTGGRARTTTRAKVSREKADA